jgi:hypothetical protein
MSVVKCSRCAGNTHTTKKSVKVSKRGVLRSFFQVE